MQAVGLCAPQVLEPELRTASEAEARAARAAVALHLLELLAALSPALPAQAHGSGVQGEAAQACADGLALPLLRALHDTCGVHSWQGLWDVTHAAPRVAAAADARGVDSEDDEDGEDEEASAAAAAQVR